MRMILTGAAQEVAGCPGWAEPAVGLRLRRVNHPLEPSVSCVALEGQACTTGTLKDIGVGYALGARLLEGTLQPRDTVVIPSSGNAAISTASWCDAHGLTCVAIVPRSTSPERVGLIRKHGAAVESIDGDMAEAVATAATYSNANGYFLFDQFSDPLIADGYVNLTDLLTANLSPKGVDAITAACGTASTLVGLKIGFETRFGRAVPAFRSRPVASGAFCDRVPGVVEGVTRLLPPVGTTGWETIDVEEDVVEAVWKHLVDDQRLSVGKSAGLNVAAAWTVSRRLGPDKVVLTVFPDHLDRYRW